MPGAAIRNAAAVDGEQPAPVEELTDDDKRAHEMPSTPLPPVEVKQVGEAQYTVGQPQHRHMTASEILKQQAEAPGDWKAVEDDLPFPRGKDCD